MKNLLLVLTISVLFLSCKKDATQIALESENACLVIYTYDEFGTPYGSGSGFFIDDNGKAVTNYHVLKGASKAIVVTNDSSKYEVGQIISADPERDLLIFHVNMKAKPTAYLKVSNTEPRKGEKVFCVGNPLGFDHTLSEGIISGLRKDKQHSNVLQFTASISPGSSGGPVLNDRGEVVAVTSFYHSGGQNLNFGISVFNGVLDNLKGISSDKRDLPINNKNDLLVFNIPSDNNPNVILNAVEFGKQICIAYLTYTNLELDKPDWCIYFRSEHDAYLKDPEKNLKMFISSSSIGFDSENCTKVPVGTSVQYKIYFASIEKPASYFELSTGLCKECPTWTHVETDELNQIENFSANNFLVVKALTTLKEGKIKDSGKILLEALEKDPESSQVLNALGIISLIEDNKSDALSYFTEAINAYPSFTGFYNNRRIVYASQNNFDLAIQDMTTVIGMDPQPDNYLKRCKLNLLKGDQQKALEDYSYSYEKFFGKQLTNSEREILFNKFLSNKNLIDQLMTKY